MRDFDYYSTADVEYPVKEDFFTVFVYRQGETVWTGPLNRYREIAPTLKNLVREHVFDNDEYEKQMQAFREEHARLEMEFKEDLFEEFDVVDNPKADKCFSLAWQYGHGAGFPEVYNYFIELVELIR
jgi:hypothetical protein